MAASSSFPLNNFFREDDTFVVPSEYEGMMGMFPSSYPCLHSHENYPLKMTNASTPNLLGGLDVPSLMDPQHDDFDENSRKEIDIICTTRVKLTEYVHDCTILHPYMKEKKIFNKHECEKIQHEVTGAQKMDMFIDIVLTKGPKAIGVFHEALGKFYPYVFDMLTRLFSAAGIELPESRQLKEELPDTGDSASELEKSVKEEFTFRRSLRQKTPTIRQTIRRHIDELTERCEAVKNQRDELQKALLLRERDINSLLSHRDQQIQQKYEDMLNLLANWQEAMTMQSNGSIQKMQELVTEHEGIREAYELHEGEYMLVVSELSAARDRISKLLSHLEKMETEFALAQEEKLDLKDKINQLEGEIERQYRKFGRIAKDATSNNERASSLENDIEHSTRSTKHKTLNNLEEISDYEEKIKVCQIERKQVIEEKESLQYSLFEEKKRRKRLEKELEKLRSNPPPYQRVMSVPSGSSDRLLQSPSLPEDRSPTPTRVVSLVDETVFMPADNPGMDIGLAVVVRSLSESGNAIKNGVRIGDEIQQVNHIKISSENEPLAFAQRLLNSAEATVTLSIKRQQLTRHHQPLLATSSLNPSISPSLITTPVSHLDMEAIYASFLKHTPVLSGKNQKRPPKLNTHISNLSASSTSNSTKSHDTRDSDDASDDSRDFVYGFSDPEISGQSKLVSVMSIDNEGIVTSPTFSGCGDCVHNLKVFHKNKGTLTGKILPESFTPEDFGSRQLEHMYDSDSTDAPMSLEIDDISPNQYFNHRPRNAIRRRKKKIIKKQQPSFDRLSKSLDDIDLLVSSPNTTPDESLVNSRDEGGRKVLLPFGQLGIGLSIVGGRGNGLFIQSNRKTDRSLRTGDQILQICGTPATEMTYAKAIELMSKYNHKGKQCLLQVEYNKEGYMKLDTHSRDNFYVKARISHRSRFRPELSFNIGDVFHVTDTKPTDQVNMWQVEKLNTRGKIIATGCIPITLEDPDCINPNGSQSLPRQFMNPRFRVEPHLTLQNQKPKWVSADAAYKLYKPVRRIEVTKPRPVVLFGVYDAELRNYLVGKGSNNDVRFSFPSREPAEKMYGVSDDKIIESITICDGIVKSTIDDVTEVAHSGHHCVLSLNPDDLTKSKILSLHPIILAIVPHSKTVKLKSIAGQLPSGFSQEALSQTAVNQIKEKIRRINPFKTGEIDVGSTINAEELIINIREMVKEQQMNYFWESD